jgi:hypothetical protein
VKLPGIICLAANVAWDAQRRISAHAIFSVLQTRDLPFKFPAPFYAVVQLFDLGIGSHAIGLEAQQGIDFRADVQTVTIEPDKGDFTILVLTVSDCVVHSYGDYVLQVTVDGKKVPVLAPLRVLEPISSETVTTS